MQIHLPHWISVYFNLLYNCVVVQYCYAPTITRATLQNYHPFSDLLWAGSNFPPVATWSSTHPSPPRSPSYPSPSASPFVSRQNESSCHTDSSSLPSGSSFCSWSLYRNPSRRTTPGWWSLLTWPMWSTLQPSVPSGSWALKFFLRSTG